MSQPIAQPEAPRARTASWSWRRFFRKDDSNTAPPPQESAPRPGVARRISRKVVPGLPRPGTFKRQQSELRDRLVPSIILDTPERRTVSTDRNRSLPRAGTFKRRQSDLRDRPVPSIILDTPERRTVSKDRNRSYASYRDPSTAVERGRRRSRPEFLETTIDDMLDKPSKPSSNSSISGPLAYSGTKADPVPWDTWMSIRNEGISGIAGRYTQGGGEVFSQADQEYQPSEDIPDTFRNSTLGTFEPDNEAMYEGKIDEHNEEMNDDASNTNPLQREFLAREDIWQGYKISGSDITPWHQNISEPNFRKPSESIFTGDSEDESGSTRENKNEIANWAVSTSDIASVASVDEDIFSTAGSLSTNSTVSSIRLTAIDHLVGVFVADNELAPLYAQAAKRLGQERFVRNQRRLLKIYFLDLRSRTQSQLHEQAIRILRGRSERTSIAEQIWSIVSPNKSKSADMKALLAQKPDKQIQLERLLGTQISDENIDEEAGLATDSESSEESEKSDSEGSDFADKEAKYPNVALATDFLVGGPAFKQYVTNVRTFLRLEVGPSTLQEQVVKGDVKSATRLLQQHFHEVAIDEFNWLHELVDIGCEFEEMAKLLIDSEAGSPWILMSAPPTDLLIMCRRWHRENCVHKGGHKIETAPRVISANTPKAISHEPERGMTGVKESIGKWCGLAGVLPLADEQDTVEWMRWTSCVQFTGEDNSVAWVSYAEEEFPAKPEIRLARIVDTLRRTCSAIGFLQESDLICDGFTVLKLDTGKELCIELSQINVEPIEELYLIIKTLEEGMLHDPTNLVRFKICSLAAEAFVSMFGERYHEHEISLDAVLNDCALAAQILSLGVLSYSQAHIGHLSPGFLVGSLQEVHLLGTSPETSSHVVTRLRNFTCMKDMVRDPVLVFQIATEGSSLSDPPVDYDLLASPQDLAITWSPTRFITEPNGTNLYAVEIRGGMINFPQTSSTKAHWSPGQNYHGEYGSGFIWDQKILIGGTIINDKCPLDETKSWQHPANYAYVKRLGTSDTRWELREKQVGMQGGQYITLAFNPTYIKQDGVTLKQQQLMLPFNEIDLAFLNSTCGLQISFCTGVARRVPLRVLLADVMVPFVESRLSKPAHWEELKTKFAIVENFRSDLGQWFDRLSTGLRESAIQIVRSMLGILKDTGIDKNGEELVIAWVRKEDPYLCLRLRCEKTSLWARILADSEDCATFACITPLCIEIEKHKCRGLEVAPWHSVSNLLDTAVCQHLESGADNSCEHTCAVAVAASGVILDWEVGIESHCQSVVDE
ncbi:uncharacterized protein BP5553_01496 [Venustampulla echinocandica]|uniref:Uncharacterized protein n=1 Tax=Venustampulla echinocandica TaxID=2656787 RepID=A0A370U170_9HELO|nr:uncharacterized protein BP5553_01496 [Venustampulla echinocandica]RDL41517.1 hypothetical protein BP5553_01496 [Venustampulla echinocandica]